MTSGGLLRDDEERILWAASAALSENDRRLLMYYLVTKNITMKGMELAYDVGCAVEKNKKKIRRTFEKGSIISLNSSLHMDPIREEDGLSTEQVVHKVTFSGKFPENSLKAIQDESLPEEMFSLDERINEAEMGFSAAECRKSIAGDQLRDVPEEDGTTGILSALREYGDALVESFHQENVIATCNLRKKEIISEIMAAV